MITPEFRQLALIEASSMLAATEILIAANILIDVNQLTRIDTTTDFNQNKWLGQELSDTLIYFNEKTKPNALLAIFGCVKGGSTLYVAYSSIEIEGYFKKQILLPKLKRIQDQLAADTIHYTDCSCDSDSHNKFNIKIDDALNCNKHIVQLTGFRGTGKSTLLGLIANRFSSANLGDIALISQYKTSSSKTLGVLNDVSRETVHYFSPAEFKQTRKDHSLILIDEAASLPKQFIQGVIERAKLNGVKVVLATTTEGYEGTGQSYRSSYLEEKDGFIITLENPLRFAERDPLHKLCQAICQPKITSHHLKDGDYILNTIELRDELLTEKCFSLLQQSHYKTTPNDLERFYNEPAIFVLNARCGEITSVLYAIPEEMPGKILESYGGLLDIFHGKRRIKDAMTQQSLINAYGVSEDLAGVKVLRISRVATAEKYRRKGVASRLIKKLAASSKEKGYDLLSSSFTLTDATFLFWTAIQFYPVRIGVNKNKSHDKYSMLMLHNLSNKQYLVDSYINKYYQHLCYYEEEYRGIGGMKNTAVKWHDSSQKELSVAELNKQIDSVVDGYRDIHWLLPILKNTYQKDAKNLSFLAPILTGDKIEKSNLEQAKLLLVKTREKKLIID